MMYDSILVPCDNSSQSSFAIDAAIEIAARTGSRIVASHVYAARLHDVRFRQLEVGLPAQYQAPEQIEHQRKVHDKLIEKGLVLISDSYLAEMEKRCKAGGVPVMRRLLEGMHFAEIIREANSDGYGLVVMGAHGLGHRPAAQLGSVVSRAMRGIDRDLLIARNEARLEQGEFLVAVDGSAYSYHAMRVALDLARRFEARVKVCTVFDSEFHHVVFDSIKEVLSAEAAKVFRFEEQEALHDNIIDRGLYKLAQANLKRALKLAEEFPRVRVETKILSGKPFEAILAWARKITPTLLVVGRHGAHRVEESALGSHAENLARLADCDVLLVGAAGVRADDIPRIDEDGESQVEWTPDADVRILRAPPFALGIARQAVGDFVRERYGNGDEPALVTESRLDEAIRELLPSHLQLLMGVGAAEELAESELRAEASMKVTVVQGHDSDPQPEPLIEETCPHSGQTRCRQRTTDDSIVWTHAAFERLESVPLLARPLARNTVERFSREHGFWRVTTAVMDENRQAMIEADEFDAENMLVMFKNLESKQLKARSLGSDVLSPETRRFVDEARAAGLGRCPLRDLEDRT